MKNITEIYKEWCGKSHNENDCHSVHDSTEVIEFAEYYWSCNKAVKASRQRELLITYEKWRNESEINELWTYSHLSLIHI